MVIRISYQRSDKSSERGSTNIQRMIKLETVIVTFVRADTGFSVDANSFIKKHYQSILETYQNTKHC